MQSGGLRKIIRGLIVAGTILAASQTTAAQQTFYLQIHMDENGQSPIAFMAPHYFIHQAEGASLSTPPTTAFTPSQIRHAYGFDLVTNQGAGQTIALVDAYDDANAASDLAVFSKQYVVRTVFLLVIFVLAYGGIVYGNASYGYVWLALSRGYSASFVFALTAWAGLIAAGVYALNALVGDRIERRTSMLAMV